MFRSTQTTRRSPAQLLTLMVIALMLSSPLSARLYDSGRSISVAKTKYFDIIFPENCRPSASRLVLTADARYEELCAYFMCTPRPRITVTLTRDMHIANGYATILPDNRITLYDSVLPISFNYSNYLDMLFTHELTHIVTLSMKDGIAKPLSAVFGNYASIPAMLPRFMIEGIAVHIESAGGFGRANHPSVRQLIMQDMAGNKFRSPGQCAGGFDVIPGGTLPYYYGGLFHKYIAAKYGDDAVRRLWTNMAWNLLGIDGAMEGELGKNFAAEWDAFKETFRSTNIFSTNARVLADGYVISAMHLSADTLWFYDELDGAVKRIDTRAPHAVHTVLPITMLRSFDVSPDGSLLMLETMPIENGLVKSRTVFYDLHTRSFTPRVINERVSDCSFWGSDILAVEGQGSQTDIVLIARNGTKRVLVRGGETLYFGRPHAVDQKTIAFLASDNGRTTLRTFDTNASLMMRYAMPAEYVMDLSVCDGKMLLAYNNDNTFYRTAVIDGTSVLLMTNIVPGGIAFPVMRSNTMYYVSSGPSHDAVMAMEMPPMLRTNAVLYPSAVPVNSDSAAILPSTPYVAFPYLLPRMWMPYAVPYLDRYGNAFVEAGILLYGSDPIEENAYLCTAVFNYVRNFAGLTFSWQNTSLPVWMTFSASDTLISANTFYDVRVTRADADLYFRIDLPFNAHYFFVRSSGSGIMASAASNTVSAYQWQYAAGAFTAGCSIGYNGITEKDASVKDLLLQAEGIAMAQWYDISLPSGAWKYEISISAAVPFLPMRFSFFGAASDRALFRPSGALPNFLPAHYPSFLEYRDDTARSRYYAYAEAKTLLFNIEIQQGILFLSLYLRRFYCTGGYRAAYCADNFLQSCYLRAHLAVYPYVPVELYAEGNYALRDNRFGYSYGIIMPIFFF